MKRKTVILRELLPGKMATGYLFDGKKACPLGQILLAQQIECENLRTPADTKMLIPYLTKELRRRVVNTALTLAVLEATKHPASHYEPKITELFKEIGKNVSFE